MSKNKVTVEFNEVAGRWVAHYERDGLGQPYLVPDWGVNAFGDAPPTLVPEIDEIFSLNFLFAYNQYMVAKTAASPPAEAPAAA